MWSHFYSIKTLPGKDRRRERRGKEEEGEEREEKARAYKIGREPGRKTELEIVREKTKPASFSTS